MNAFGCEIMHNFADEVAQRSGLTTRRALLTDSNHNQISRKYLDFPWKEWQQRSRSSVYRRLFPYGGLSIYRMGVSRCCFPREGVREAGLWKASSPRLTPFLYTPV